MTLFGELLADLDTQRDGDQAPEVSASSKTVVCRSALESIDHLQKKVCLMWGTAELDVFIRRLIMDSRDGARRGLPADVAADMLFVAQTNKIIRALDTAQRLGLNLQEAYNLVDTTDNSRLEADVLDNPEVSHDTIQRTSKSAVKPAVANTQPRHEPVEGAIARIGQGVFQFATSKVLIFLIIAALGLKLVWPSIAPLFR
jgi:hypothetical protein